MDIGQYIHGNPILERRSTVLLLLCMYVTLRVAPGILKQGGVKSSCQRLISSIGKTKRIAFFWQFFLTFQIFGRKKKYFF